MLFRAEAATVDGIAIDWANTADKGFYLGMFTAMPTPTSSGTEVSTSGTNYARVQMKVTGTSAWSIGVSGNEVYAYNTAALTFSSGVTGSWGTLVGFGLFSASSSGNLWAFGPLTSSFTPATADPIVVPAGALRVTLLPSS